MISRDAAGIILDEVMYSRVLECIDLEKLFVLELDFFAALVERGYATDEIARDEASDMIDRALERFAQDPDRYAPVQPFGMPCGFCDDETADAARRRYADSAKSAPEGGKRGQRGPRVPGD